MSWSKVLILGSAALLFSGAVYAEKITCPTVLKEGNKTYRMNLVDVFVGPPEELASLLPDTDEEMVWTLKDSQDYAREHNTAVFLVCQYKGTKKTATLKVPQTAQKCSAGYGNSKDDFYASCE
ncbi:STY0301 family protein [Enterobacter sp. Bisph1]|uniref:STY0301 family protein n=1 Tax=Enterobacter sp. Bisph1 TaxID=1274399 RepID=UPI00057BEF8A|nr:STY0301 family protein [Enterobacter sp. Bisph1]